MSEGILFGIGFIVFIFVTTAVLMFGYARFNQLYREDRAAGGGPEVRTEGSLEFYAEGGVSS
jgi:hypothetical protein